MVGRECIFCIVYHTCNILAAVVSVGVIAVAVFSCRSVIGIGNIKFYGIISDLRRRPLGGFVEMSVFYTYLIIIDAAVQHFLDEPELLLIGGGTCGLNIIDEPAAVLIYKLHGHIILVWDICELILYNSSK